jgi:hypothetical protein
MGKYRAQFSLPNHLFGTVKVYDDDDAVVQHRVASGMLVRVDGPPAATGRRSAVRAEPEVVTAPVEVVEPETASEEKPKKQSASQRRAKKAPARKTDPEPEVEVEGSGEVAEEQPPTPDLGKSSVQTAWTISD